MQKQAKNASSEPLEAITKQDLIAKFIARADRLEIRYKGQKFADGWLVPKEEMLAVRDELVMQQRGLFT